MSHEYLLRVKSADDGYTASVRQFAGTAHPEVRCVIGPVSMGHGQTELAAMISALSNARLGVEVHEVHRGC